MSPRVLTAETARTDARVGRKLGDLGPKCVSRYPRDRRLYKTPRPIRRPPSSARRGLGGRSSIASSALRPPTRFSTKPFLAPPPPPPDRSSERIFYPPSPAPLTAWTMAARSDRFPFYWAEDVFGLRPRAQSAGTYGHAVYARRSDSALRLPSPAASANGDTRATSATNDRRSSVAPVVKGKTTVRRRASRSRTLDANRTPIQRAMCRRRVRRTLQGAERRHRIPARRLVSQPARL